MSRLGKLPIEIPEGVELKLDKEILIVKGSKGELQQNILPVIDVIIKDKQVIIKPKDLEAKKVNAFWGLTWSLVRNMVIGVSEGFEKKLEINGVGYRATVSEKKIDFNLGYSHPIVFNLPEGIKAVLEGKVLTISGIDKQAVGEVAAKIRKLRKPEPYKGKGIKYLDEIIRRKAGKTAAKGE